MTNHLSCMTDLINSWLEFVQKLRMCDFITGVCKHVLYIAHAAFVSTTCQMFVYFPIYLQGLNGLISFIRLVNGSH